MILRGEGWNFMGFRDLIDPVVGKWIAYAEYNKLDQLIDSQMVFKPHEI